MSNFVSSSVVLVENIDAISNFFHTIFDFDSPVAQLQPFQHKSIKISNSSIIVFVKPSACDSTILSAINSLAVRRLFVTVENIQIIQQRALQAGANLIETLPNSMGGGCILECPEKKCIFVMNHSSYYYFGPILNNNLSFILIPYQNELKFDSSAESDNAKLASAKASRT